MTRNEEDYLFECIEHIQEDVHLNNQMLRSIIKVINTYIVNHNKENEEDFGRNVLANLISSTFDLSKFTKRK